MTLATGSRDLADKAMMPTLAPKVAVMLPSPVAVPSAPRSYSVNDTDVVAPVAVRQDIPTYTRPVTIRTGEAGRPAAEVSEAGSDHTRPDSRSLTRATPAPD